MVGQSVAPSPDWRLAVVLALFVLIAVLGAMLGQTGVARAQVTAALRAVVQLGLVALVITAALGSLGWSSLVVAVMFTVAALTSARRIGVTGAGRAWVAVAVAAGAAPVVALTLLSGVVPFNGAGIVPVAGIIIGGAMTAATLAGRRCGDELTASFGAYEAAVSLGLRGRDAALLVLRPRAAEALVPGLDQTRTVGLVTLPGAFVGVLLGGGTPVEAAAAQLLVLLGLLASQAVTVTTIVELVARGRLVHADLRGRYPR